MKVNTTSNVKMEKETPASVQKMMAREPMVTVCIPMAAGESSTVECCLNGYCYVMKRGERIEVPKPVAELLHHAGLI